jgi:actin-related protein
VREIKERFGYVAVDYIAEIKKDPAQIEKSFTMPDGNVIKVGNERFRCAEALFEPSLLGNAEISMKIDYLQVTILEEFSILHIKVLLAAIWM